MKHAESIYYGTISLIILLMLFSYGVGRGFYPYCSDRFPVFLQTLFTILTVVWLGYAFAATVYEYHCEGIERLVDEKLAKYQKKKEKEA